MGILVALLLAYANSFSGVFLFDDYDSIIGDAVIKHPEALRGQAFGGARLIPTLTFAANYAFGGLNPLGYHVVNLAIHLLTSWVLFALLRRVFQLPSIREDVARAATFMAFSTALLWTVHPLQTESVTYVVQRAESLCALFYLLTFYCAVRGASEQATGGGAVSGRVAGWYSAAVVSCALGALTKAVIVTAPVLLLCFDRAFLADSWAALWRRRRWLYVGLFATWGLLWRDVATAVSPDATAANAGFGLAVVTPLEYLRSQPGVILHYLRLAVWPDVLCLDYGWPVAEGVMGGVVPAVLVGALLALSVAAALRGWKAGFLGIAFFMILAPTSSIMPIADLAVEHRMYLPLAAVAAAFSLAIFVVVRRCCPTDGAREASGQALWALVAVVALALIGRTAIRNFDYSNEVLFWTKNTAAAPGNHRGYSHLAYALIRAGRNEEALTAARAIVRLKPDGPQGHVWIAYSYLGMDQIPKAEEAVLAGLRVSADDPPLQFLMGRIRLRQDRLQEAESHLREVLTKQRRLVPAHAVLATVLARQGRVEAAIDEAVWVWREQPRSPESHALLGDLLVQAGRYREALKAYRSACALDPAGSRTDLLLRMAWLLSACPDAGVRNGREALSLVRRVQDVCGEGDPSVLETLSAALAEAGDFDAAVRAARDGAIAARAANLPAVADRLDRRAAQFAARQPVRETRPPAK